MASIGVDAMPNPKGQVLLGKLRVFTAFVFVARSFSNLGHGLESDDALESQVGLVTGGNRLAGYLQGYRVA